MHRVTTKCDSFWLCLLCLLIGVMKAFFLLLQDYCRVLLSQTKKQMAKKGPHHGAMNPAATSHWPGFQLGRADGPYDDCLCLRTLDNIQSFFMLCSLLRCSFIPYQGFHQQLRALWSLKSSLKSTFAPHPQATQTSYGNYRRTIYVVYLKHDFYLCSSFLGTVNSRFSNSS